MAIEYRKEGRIGLVGLNTPETKNAFSSTHLLDLCRIWDECQADDELRAVVVYSELDGMFCAGMDLKSSIPLLTGERPCATAEERYLFAEEQGFAGFSKALLKVKPLDRPVIAAIHGWCLTAGFELAMGCELRIASPDAKFQMRESRLGIMPMSGSNVFLPIQVGATRALEILLTGDVYDADTLHRWGFLNRVVPRAELLDQALQLGERIAANGPKAVRGMVRMHRELLGKSWEEAFEREVEIALPVFRSDDPREGIRAQLERRKASFG